MENPTNNTHNIWCNCSTFKVHPLKDFSNDIKLRIVLCDRLNIFLSLAINVETEWITNTDVIRAENLSIPVVWIVREPQHTLWQLLGFLTSVAVNCYFYCNQNTSTSILARIKRNIALDELEQNKQIGRVCCNLIIK